MKKILCLICSIILIITAGTLGFLQNRNKLQAVLFSLGTALLSGETFAVRNYKTDNVYVLQTKKGISEITLYRRMADGNMLRYRVFEKTLQKDGTDQNGWIPKSTADLPADVPSVIKELGNLYREKSTGTASLKAYMDLLFSAVTSNGGDSTLLIDYKAFPAVFKEIKQLFKSAETKKSVAFQLQIRKTEKIYTFTPFASKALCRQIADTAAKAIHEEYRSDFADSLFALLHSANGIKTEVRTNIFGQFLSFSIIKDNSCVFSVNKLK